MTSSRERLRSGSLAALRDRGVSGVTPTRTIFARAISDSDAYAGQIRDLKLRQVPVDQALRELTTFRRAAGVRRAAHGVRGNQRRERAGADRGRPADRPRHRPHGRRGPRAVVAGRPARPVHQHPGSPAGPVRDHRLPGRGDQHQRHADLLPRPLHRGDRGIRPAWKPPAPPGGTCPASPRWRRSSCPAWTPRSTVGWTRSARRRPPRCAARPPSPRPGSPTSVTSRPSRPDGGGRWSGPEPGRSVRCGPPPASRTLPTTTPGTSPAWSHPA